jgi:hypothetical protein
VGNVFGASIAKDQQVLEMGFRHVMMGNGLMSDCHPNKHPDSLALRLSVWSIVAERKSMPRSCLWR